MELKIKIPDSIYEEIKEEGQVSFSELHELFDGIRNGIPADEALDNVKSVSSKEIDDHVEICRLMTVFLGRKFTPHEGHFMALYKTIEQNKEMFAGLKGEDKILVKLLIRSLVPTEE